MNEDKTQKQPINDLSISQREIAKLRKSEIEQKETIETLKRSEEFFRSIIQHATDIVIVVNKIGEITYVSPSIEYLLGYTPEMLIGKSAYDYIAKVDIPRAIYDFGRAVLTNNIVISNSFGVKHSDGSIRILEGVGKSLFDNTAVKGFVMNVHDITERRRTEKELTSYRKHLEDLVYERTYELANINTQLRVQLSERKQAEEALRESEERYRGIIENVLDVYYRTDKDGKISMVSPSGLTLLGYDSIDELAGKSISDALYFDPNERDKILSILREKGSVKDFEAILKHKDGTPIPVTTSSHYYYDERGNILGVEGIFHDITERKKIEEVLKNSEEKYRHLVNNINQGIFVAQDNMLKFVNPQSIEIFDQTEHDLTTKPFIEFIHPDDRSMVLDRHIRRLRGEIFPTKYEFRIITAGGDTKWIEIDSVMTQWGGKQATLGFFSDITDRKRVEAALRESEEKFRNLAEKSIVGIYLIQDGVFKYVNSKQAEICEYRIDEMIDKIMVKDAVFPEDWPLVEENMRQRVFGEQTSTHYAFRVFTKNRKIKYTEVYSSRITYQGKPAIIGAMLDITERKKMEETLLESEEKYRILLEESSDPIFSFTPEGQYKYVNRAFAEGVGRPVGDIIGKRIWDVFSKEEADKRFAPLSEVFCLGEEKAIEVRVPRADGDRYYVTTITPIKDKMGVVVSAICSSKDITRRKQAEEALKESEALLKSYLENAPDGIYHNDLQGKFLYGNHKSEEIIGYSREEMIGRNFQELNILPEQSLKKAMKMLQASREGKSTGPDEIELISKDGRRIPIEINTSVVQYKDKTIVLGFVRDITERKKLEEHLHRAEKMEALGTLAGGVAHDLNNVLGVLVGYSELILRKTPESSSLKKYAENIIQSSLKGSAIIQDLLTLARRGVNVSEVVNLNKLVADYLEAPELEKLKTYHPGVKICTELEDGLLNIKGSPIHLSKTIMNLVSNAAEAISGEGNVTIRTENRYVDQPICGYDKMPAGDYTILIVSDTGSGISSRDIGKIFEPFYTKKVMGKSGTGLGLAVVWGTVKDHDGYIDVKSGEGSGSTFSLYFPATREVSAKVDKRVIPVSYIGKGEFILVVDDRKEQCEVAISMLDNLGYKVESVDSGEKAVEYIKNKKADLIVLDMIMDPGIDGMETYRRILEINPSQKAIIVSGFSETNRVRKTQELGAGTFVRKPYVLEKIGLAIRKELDRK